MRENRSRNHFAVYVCGYLLFEGLSRKGYLGTGTDESDKEKRKTMKRQFMMRIAAVFIAAAMIFAVAGCGQKDAEPKTFIDVQEDGSVLANFDKTGKGTAGGTGITIEENEYLVIDTALTAGKVHVTVVRGGTDADNPPALDDDTPAAIDFVFEDSGTTEYMEIQPGDYMFTVNVEEKATGTITASKRNRSDDTAAAGGTTAAQ